MNGSNDTINCQEVFVIYDVMFCGHNLDPGTTYLTDGITPDIDTSAPNWASQLVTVRKNTATPQLKYPSHLHILYPHQIHSLSLFLGVQCVVSDLGHRVRELTAILC